MHSPPALTIAGGDGTLFHLLCRLSPPWPPLVLVPQGRGNALARDVGAGQRAVVDALLVAAARPTGEMVQCYSLSSVGLGYPSVVTRRAFPLRFLRRLSYAAASLFTRPQWHEFRISVGAEPPRSARLRGVLVNNTRFTGGFEALPRASSRDGVAELLELTAGWLRQLAHNLSVMTGLHCYESARVTAVRRCRITPQHAMELMIDGELLGPVSSVEIEVIPAALDIRIGPALEPEGCGYQGAA